jgi:ArsR family metal-binding transcriptional regulator
MAMLGSQPRVLDRRLSKLVEEGIFEPDKEIEPRRQRLDDDPIAAMQKLKRMDELTRKLPGRLCGACGAPDCRTLAEDAVLGQARLSDCPFLEPQRGDEDE